MEEIVCPHCGCKGKKKPHKRIMDAETAQEHAWKDMWCGSCGEAFKSYPWPPRRQD